MTGSDRALELPHAPGPEALWGESWYFDFSTDRSDVHGGFARLTVVPGLGRAWWWSVVVTARGASRCLRHDLELPPPGAPLSVGDAGVRASLECTAPMTGWRLSQRGGDAQLDLEWEAVAPPVESPQPAGRAHAGHYQQPGLVRGRLEHGGEALEVEALGERAHWWGVHDWWRLGWHWAAFQVPERMYVSLVRPDVPVGYAAGYVARPDGEPHRVAHVEADGVPPAPLHYRIDGDLEVAAEALHTEHIPVRAPDGRVSTLVRALCRFEVAGGPGPGERGTGWVEVLRVGEGASG